MGGVTSGVGEEGVVSPVQEQRRKVSSSVVVSFISLILTWSEKIFKYQFTIFRQFSSTNFQTYV